VALSRGYSTWGILRHRRTQTIHLDTEGHERDGGDTDEEDAAGAKSRRCNDCRSARLDLPPSRARSPYRHERLTGSPAGREAAYRFEKQASRALHSGKLRSADPASGCRQRLVAWQPSGCWLPESGCWTSSRSSFPIPRVSPSVSSLYLLCPSVSKNQRPMVTRTSWTNSSSRIGTRPSGTGASSKVTFETPRSTPWGFSTRIR
jgi:hypothetical protein